MNDAASRIDDAQLAQIQLVLGDTYRRFAAYCKERDLPVFLAAGTALGAIRHQGFIPWDDDIDCGMLREDFDRLGAVWQADPVPGFFLQTWQSEPGYLYGFAKLQIGGTAIEGCDDMTGVVHNGLFIDIFPYDTLPASALLLKVQRLAIGAINMLIMPLPQLSGGRQLPWARRMGRQIARPLHNRVILKAMLGLRDWLYRLPYAAKSDLLACYCMFGITSHARTVVAHSDIVPLREAQFGESVQHVPGNAHAYLERLYGDYMALPPLDERVGSHIFRVDFGEHQCDPKGQ